jgi:hypothetical protein
MLFKRKMVTNNAVDLENSKFHEFSINITNLKTKELFFYATSFVSTCGNLPLRV